MSRAELARRADIKPTMLHDIVERNSTPSVANLFKIAQALNFSLSELYEGKVASTSRLPITGVYEGGAVLDISKHDVESTVSVNFHAEDLESIKVKSDQLELGGYRRGDVLMGVKTAANRAGNLIGKDCIVAMPNGDRTVAHLTKHVGPSHYNLRFFHRSLPDREGVEIAWAAPISMIVRE